MPFFGDLRKLISPPPTRSMGHGVNTYKIQNRPPYITGPTSSLTYTLLAPGPDPSRQDSSHPHQVRIDPTGQFALIPDLGADLVRVYRVDQGSCTIVPVAMPGGAGGIDHDHVPPREAQAGVVNPGDLRTPQGMGPRHGVFYTRPGKRGRGGGGLEAEAEADYYLLVGELSNEVVVYECIYHPGAGSADSTGGLEMDYDWLELRLRQRISVYALPGGGGGGVAPANATAAEIEIDISPDEKTTTVYVSNRGDQSFPSAHGRSDSIATFTLLDPDAGKDEILRPQGLFPCGGRGPRHFAVSGGLLGSGPGTEGERFVTVACEGSGEVVVWKVPGGEGQGGGWEEVGRVTAGEEGGGGVGEGPSWVGWL